MFAKALYVITLVGWVIYLTYTMTAALTDAPHLPEAPRSVVLAGLVVAGFTALLHAFGARLVARLTGELRRAVADARRPDVPAPEPAPAPAGGDLRGIDPQVLDAGLRIRRRIEGP